MNFYSLCLLSLCMFFSSLLSAQDTVYYTYPLIFEDAVGNKDTVYASIIEDYRNDEDRPFTQSVAEQAKH